MTLFNSQPFKSAPDRCHSARKIASLFSLMEKEDSWCCSIGLLQQSALRDTLDTTGLLLLILLGYLTFPVLLWVHGTGTIQLPSIHQIFPFWHGAIDPRNLPATKSHAPSCKLCSPFQWARTEREDLSHGMLSLKEAFKVYLQNRDHWPLLTALVPNRSA